MITPLHVHTAYSLLRGTVPLERLVARAAELGYASVAMTDVNGLYGAPQFCQRAAEAGLEPILGAELRDAADDAILALIADDTGYENLCRLITRLRCDEGFALAGGLGEFQEGLQLVLIDPPPLAPRLAAPLEPHRLWLAIDPQTQTESHLRAVCRFADQRGLPLVATAPALFDDAEVARLLTAIRLGGRYDDLAPDALPHPKATLRAPAELAEALADYPQAVRNNRRLAERCADFHLLPRKPVFPKYEKGDRLLFFRKKFPVPFFEGQRTRQGPISNCPRASARGCLEHLPCRRAFEGPDCVQTLRRRCERGMIRRYGDPPPPRAHARLDRELRLIERMGFSEYFLVVAEIVDYARRQGAPVAGRGSGAGSLAAYVLGITNVCPLRYRIPFERFLHEQRDDFPDLDVDFCWRIRDDVIDYAFDRWGRDRVAMVSAHSTFQPRSALREAAKAFGFSDEQISQGDDLERDARMEPIARLARRLIGLPHHLSVHPGGIVIGRKPIDHYAPIQPAAKGVTITQYDKDGVEAVGLVKLDLLGNRNLSTVRHACDLIRTRRGRAIDIEAIPPDDSQTIALLRGADTVGCNQLESPAMRNLLKMMQPADARDVMKVLALIRPGAAGIGMKETFIRRHRGLEPVPAGHPRVDALLRDTHGVMLYEDDVMQVASFLLGGDLASGDRFRKAVQKCRNDADRLVLSTEFLDRCRADGVDPDYVKTVWVQMAKFNAYSFCRAHAASYAQLAYAGAYLKAHYPLEFWTAALNNSQSMYPPRVYVRCAARAGVAFRLPDVNRSGAEFVIDDGDVRVGLSFVDGLGPVGVLRILDARKAGAFADLTDFLRRTRTPLEEARSLILCGAMDFTGRTRPSLMMELNLFRPTAARVGPGQTAMLSAPPTLPEAPEDYSPLRKYMDELRILGVSVRGHVMTLHRPRLRGLTDADSRDLPRRTGRRVKIAGVVEARRTTRTQRGDTMMFLTLDDEYGLFEVTVFPDRLRRLAHPFGRYGPYVVTGKLEDQYGAITVAAEAVELLDGSLDAGTDAPKDPRP